MREMKLNDQQMALGKCVLATRVPSLVDYMEDGVTAMTYEAKNVEDLAQKMELLLTDARLRDEIAQNGGQYLKQKCNETIMAGEIEDYFHQIAQ